MLIPRPDTEVLVEEALKFIPSNKSQRIMDAGTGSGCILLSILLERKKCFGVGIDVSKEAIHIAKYNAKIQQLENRSKFFNVNIDKFIKQCRNCCHFGTNSSRYGWKSNYYRYYYIHCLRFLLFNNYSITHLYDYTFYRFNFIN